MTQQLPMNVVIRIDGQLALPWPDEDDDPPRYNYRQAIEYAIEMGLPTEFPL